MHVLVRVRYSWVVYNMFNAWVFVMAAGLLWGAYWLAVTFGLDPLGMLAGLADWGALGWGTLIGAGFLVAGALGTTQGLFRRREVDRDDNWLRGVTISEPLLWRWMGTADTTVITTGLSMWSTAPTILPRGPVGVARTVAAAVLEASDGSPFDVPLRGHPRAALRRRMIWATVVVAVGATVSAWIAGPAWWLAGAALWPLLLILAGAAYRALGHAAAGEYVIARSGLLARATSALRRRAVSGSSVRQSVLQRRLGLATVSVTTAAGDGVYEVPDMSAAEALGFLTEASPGLWDRFLSRPAPSGSAAERPSRRR